MMPAAGSACPDEPGRTPQFFAPGTIALPAGVQAAPRSAAHRPLRLLCVRVSAGHCSSMSDPESTSAEPGEPYGIVAIAASAHCITPLCRVHGGVPDCFPLPVVMAQQQEPRHKTMIK